MYSAFLTSSPGFFESIGNTISKINGKVNNIVWGLPMLVLLLGAGIYLSFRTGFFQISHFRHWWTHTIVAVFKDRKVTKSRDGHSISQFQALATAMSATVGTGNIVGVATAIASGGPGAVFWMWVLAFFGMITKFAENVLGIYFRGRNEKGEWVGGTMIYIEKGLKAKWLAVLFSALCLFASFGIGNIAQINSISSSLQSSFGIPLIATGIVLALLVAFVVIGGLKRVASVSEKLVPFMVVIYFIGAIIVIICNASRVPAAFGAIFSGAFSLRSVEGGLMGFVIMKAIRFGMARGAFSNEAGLGSSCMVHSSADVKEPVEQGMWAIFEVFTDTIIVCSLTALCILTTGANEVAGIKGAQVTAYAFETVFGVAGDYIITITVLLFAFSTVLGWSVYGSRAAHYLGGDKLVFVYRLLFVCVTFVGALSSVQLVWDISDTFNGLMAIPNLIALFGLSGTVFKIVKNYKARVFDGDKIDPMLSYSEMQAKK